MLQALFYGTVMFRQYFLNLHGYLITSELVFYNERESQSLPSEIQKE